MSYMRRFNYGVVFAVKAKFWPRVRDGTAFIDGRRLQLQHPARFSEAHRRSALARAGGESVDAKSRAGFPMTLRRAERLKANATFENRTHYASLTPPFLFH